jgi:hypothetical protein
MVEGNTKDLDMILSRIINPTKLMISEVLMLMKLRKM